MLRAALPDAQDRALLQWFGGYLLYPSCKHEVFLVSYGPGGTGKSTVSDAIMGALGAGARTVLSMAQICAEGQGAYSLPSMQYVLVNMGTEMDTIKIGDSANFKRLVSGEPIESRSIYSKPFVMTTLAKLWFNSNGLPRFKNGTDAELRRSRFLFFNCKVKDKDVTLKERRAVERDGMLSWLVQALQLVVQGMAAPEGGMGSVGVKNLFGISNDPVANFIKECCVLKEGEEVLKDVLHRAYEAWMGDQGFSQKTKDQLCQNLLQGNPTIRPLRRHKDRSLESGKVLVAGRYLTGISLNEAGAGLLEEIE